MDENFVRDLFKTKKYADFVIRYIKHEQEKNRPNSSIMVHKLILSTDKDMVNLVNSENVYGCDIPLPFTALNILLKWIYLYSIVPHDKKIDVLEDIEEMYVMDLVSICKYLLRTENIIHRFVFPILNYLMKREENSKSILLQKEDIIAIRDIKWLPLELKNVCTYILDIIIEKEIETYQLETLVNLLESKDKRYMKKLVERMLFLICNVISSGQQKKDILIKYSNLDPTFSLFPSPDALKELDVKCGFPDLLIEFLLAHGLKVSSYIFNPKQTTEIEQQNSKEIVSSEIIKGNRSTLTIIDPFSFRISTKIKKIYLIRILKKCGELVTLQKCISCISKNKEGDIEYYIVYKTRESIKEAIKILREY